MFYAQKLQTIIIVSHLVSQTMQLWPLSDANMAPKTKFNSSHSNIDFLFHLDYAKNSLSKETKSDYVLRAVIGQKKVDKQISQ